MMRTFAIVVATLALVLGGCGDDEDEAPQPSEPAAEADPAPAPSEAETDDDGTAAKPAGVSADAAGADIVACINDAGGEATLEETAVAGTRTDLEHLFVKIDGFDFGGHIFVFGSEKDLATDEKAVAAFGAQGEALGRVYFAYQNPASPQSEGVDVAKACLPEA